MIRTWYKVPKYRTLNKMISDIYSICTVDYIFDVVDFHFETAVKGFLA